MPSVAQNFCIWILDSSLLSMAFATMTGACVENYVEPTHLNVHAYCNPDGTRSRNYYDLFEASYYAYH